MGVLQKMKLDFRIAATFLACSLSFYGGNASAVSLSFARQKIGINLGVYTTQTVINELDNNGNVGTWYYNYSPHPNRTTYYSVSWANQYGKKFVPMIQQKRFLLTADASQTCGLIPEFAASGEPVCDTNVIAQTLAAVKAQFGSSNQPEHLFTFNEPYVFSATDPSGYAMDPVASAKAFGKIQLAAASVNLKVLAPTSGIDPVAVQWMATFLKACYDRRANAAEPCNIEQIYAFNVHEYRCEESFWNTNYIQRGFQTQLVNAIGGYGGYNWQNFFNLRTVWVSETNCNWSTDYKTASENGMYIRTPSETCSRATGQRSGYGKGSLATMIEATNANIERFAWWNTYANPLTDSDTGAVAPAAQNRIVAARLFDDAAHLTPAGLAYKQAHVDYTKRLQVSCVDHSGPSTKVGLFKYGGNVYHGFKDFFCRYNNHPAAEAAWRSPAWQSIAVDVTGTPTQMTDSGVCGTYQAVHRDGGTFYYTYKLGFTCWINSTSMLSSWAGLNSSQALTLKSEPLSAMGLTYSGSVCQ